MTAKKPEKVLSQNTISEESPMSTPTIIDSDDFSPSISTYISTNTNFPIKKQKVMSFKLLFRSIN